MNSYSGPLTLGVHWLNNKALVFSLGVEKILAEALATAEKAGHEENSRDSSISLITLDIIDSVSGKDSHRSKY